MQLLKELLEHNIIIDKGVVRRRTKWMADGILEHDTSGRSYDQIYANTLSGVICEVGVAMLCGSLNEQDFDVKERDTYAWDVLSRLKSKRRIEIKLHKDKWYTYYPDSINTMMNNIKHEAFDYLVTANYVEQRDYYVVTPRLIIEPSTFRKYCKRSQFANSGTSYYDHNTASYDNQCIKLF
jgi:hypothetical protein|tara:strand:+ start:901 stop:1443 length:543 start_codon:yes stop_codon:yes gene_type:complete